MMVLYKVDLLPSGQVQDALDGFEVEHGFELPSYARELVVGIASDIERVDVPLESCLDSWSLDRLGAVERAILRIAMFELVTGIVPPQVAIDEAIELAKRYASPEAAKLVNGVLGGYVRSAAAAAAPASEPEQG